MFRMLIAAIACLAIAFSGVSAVPMNQQSCKAKNYGLVIAYDISVGRYYMQSKCDRFVKNIKASGALPSMIGCAPGPGGTFKIRFNAMRDRANKINNALNNSFPAIRDNGGFNCPNH